MRRNVFYGQEDEEDIWYVDVLFFGFGLGAPEFGAGSVFGDPGVLGKSGGWV